MIPAHRPYPAQSLVPGAPASALKRLLLMPVPLLDGVTWRGMAAVVAIALMLVLWSQLGNLPAHLLQGTLTWRDTEYAMLDHFLQNLFLIALQALAVVLVENLHLEGSRRIAALIAAVTIGAVLATPIRCFALGPDNDTCVNYEATSLLDWRRYKGALTTSAPLGGLIVLAFFTRRRDKEVANALHAAQLKRAATEREMITDQLRGLQARVEPAFLFGTLADVRALYDRDAAKGERMLDELIRFLRAALPQLRSHSSTWDHESRLLKAWLAIQQIRAGGRLAFEVSGDDVAGDSVLPPMLLLPIASEVLPPDVEATGAQAALTIDARPIDGRLRLAFEGSAGRLGSETADQVLTDVRARLAALYGASATLAIQSAGSRRGRIIVEIPHERIESGPR